MISYRISFNNTLHDGESYWFGTLSENERDQYELVITAIIHWTRAASGRYTAQDIIRIAIEQGFTDSMIVAAVVWRLYAEVSRS